MAKHRDNDPYAHNKLISDSTIVGEVYTKADFRLDGILRGVIRTEGKLVIGKTGRVEGKVFCKTTDVFGYVEGEIHAEDILSMKAGCHVKGNIYADKLVVELGCDFNGRCCMDGSYVEETATESELDVAKPEPVVTKEIEPVAVKAEPIAVNTEKIAVKTEPEPVQNIVKPEKNTTKSKQNIIAIQNAVMPALESRYAPHQRKSIWRTL